MGKSDRFSLGCGTPFASVTAMSKAIRNDNPDRQSGQPRRDKVVIGASAGGIPALISLVSTLPRGFRAAILIVLHLSPRRESHLAQILGRHTALPASTAKHGEVIDEGHIYVAKPGVHLMVGNGELRLEDGPRINWHKPAVDALFISAAEEFGPRTIGVVLTGGQNCGTAGLIEIKRRGGISVVQDPADAEHPQMPLSAIKEANVDYCLSVDEIGPLLSKLVGS